MSRGTARPDPPSPRIEAVPAAARSHESCAIMALIATGGVTPEPAKRKLDGVLPSARQSLSLLPKPNAWSLSPATALTIESEGTT